VHKRLTLLLLVLVVAGCGGDEGNDVAERLAVRSESVAAEVEAGDACAARVEAEALQEEAIAAVNAGDLPQELQEDVLGAVNALLGAIGCDPAVALDSASTDARALAALLRSS
jgi:hypothetical protein